MEILAPEANTTKFCIHNRWTSRELEMQKLGAGVRVGVEVDGGGTGG